MVDIGQSFDHELNTDTAIKHKKEIFGNLLSTIYYVALLQRKALIFIATHKFSSPQAAQIQ